MNRLNLVKVIEMINEILLSDQSAELEHETASNDSSLELTSRIVEEQVTNIFASANQSVLCSFFNITRTRADIEHFKGTGWLSTDDIDLYLKIICAQNLDCFSILYGFHFHCSNAFIPSNVDILRFRCVFIPILESSHYTLAVIYPQESRIVFYDSFGSRSLPENILAWLKQLLHSRGRDYESEGWQVHNAVNRDHPDQRNSHDCGPFICQYAKKISLKQGNWFKEVN